VPLKVRPRKGTSALWITGTIKGRRIRESTGTDIPAVAETIRAAREAQLLEDAVFGRSPTVPFRVAAEQYLKYEPRGVSQTRAVNRLVSVLGHRPTRDINQADADLARAKLCRQGITPATMVRSIISPLSAVLHFARFRRWCDRPEFDWPHIQDTPPNAMTPAQAEALIGAAAPHLVPLAVFFFCTGARSGEALGLDWTDVDLAGARATFWEGRTKTGRRRVVQLVPRAVAMLASLPHRTGPVFRRDDGEPYSRRPGAGGAIRTAWGGACIRAGLPATPLPEKEGRKSGRIRQARPLHTPHDARHSWASWHYAVHRDLLKLKHDGGWASAAEVETYAHLMPEGTADAIRRFWGFPAAPGTLLTQPKRRRA
jgi:integrase